MFRKNKLFLTLLIILLVQACASQKPAYKADGLADIEGPANLQSLLLNARQSSSPKKEAYLLDAVFLLRNDNDIDQAFNILEQLPFPSLPVDLKGRYLIEYSELHFKTHDTDKILGALAGDSFNLNDYYDKLSLDKQIALSELRARAYATQGKYLESVKEYMFITPLIPKDEIGQHYETIWDNLSNLPTNFLEEQIQISAQNELKGWLELAYLNHAYQYDISTQITHLKIWLTKWSQHPAASQLPNSLNLLLKYAEDRPSKIAVILPFGGKLSATANIIRDGIIASHFAAQNDNSSTPTLVFFNSAGTSSIESLYQSAVDGGAELIIGPLSKENVRSLQNLDVLPVDTLALNRSDLEIKSPEKLYQFGLNPEDEVIQVANRAWEDGHVNAAILFPENEYGYRIAEKFETVWNKRNGNLVASTAYSPKGNYKQAIKSMLKIEQSESRAHSLSRITGMQMEFHPRRRDDVDFIFIVASPIQARQLKPTLLHADAKDLSVYSTSSAYDHEGDKNGKNDDINGLLFCDIPWILLDDDEIKTLSRPVWPNMSTRASRLFALGVDAYRLQGRLAILQAAPETRVHGATGSLSMDAQGHVKRELVWAEIKNGRLKELPLFYGDLSE